MDEINTDETTVTTRNWVTQRGFKPLLFSQFICFKFSVIKKKMNTHKVLLQENMQGKTGHCLLKKSVLQSGGTNIRT